MSFTEALSLLAASSSDSKILFRVLARDLSETIGDRVIAERAGRFGKSAEEIVAISINLNPETFGIEQTKTGITCSIAVTSGGVKIRTEHPELAQWVKRLTDALQQEATASESSRQALERLLIGGSS